jgi:transcriptional regulator with XRE-family HTH domain
MVDQPRFGQRLKALRVERGLSQAALAGEVISTGYLSRLESGARAPTPRVVTYLAERLGVAESAFNATTTTSLARVLASVTSADDWTDVDALVHALRVDDGREPELRWQGLWLLARCRADQGAHEEEYRLLVELDALATELGVPELHVRTRTQLSRCARILGDNVKAREYAAEAVERSADLGPADRTAALHALISADAEAGRLVEAREHADQLVKLADTAPGTASVKALWASATVSIRQGDHRAAQDALERALLGLDSREDLELWIRLRLAAASLYLQSTPAQVEQASTRLEEVSPVVALMGSELHQQEVLSLCAHLAFAQERYADARELVGRLDGRDVRLSFRDRVRLDALGGRLQIIEGDTDGGVERLQQLAKKAHDAHNVELAADIWRGLAETLSGRRGGTTG